MKKVLFILGTAHCGSTLLSLILDSHSRCFAVGELSNLPRIYQYREHKKKYQDFWQLQFNAEERLKLSLVLSNRRISRLIPLKIEKTIRELFKDELFRPYSTILSKTNAEVIVDSTKVQYWISQSLSLREVKQEFEVYLLHLVRDGRAVFNSYRRKRKRMTSTEISKMWLERVQSNEEFYYKFSQGKKMQLAYEELVTEPEEKIREVCNFLDVSFEPKMLDYWRYEHHLLSGNTRTKSSTKKYKDTLHQDNEIKPIRIDLSWQESLSEAELQLFYKIAGKTNKKYEWNNS